MVSAVSSDLLVTGVKDQERAKKIVEKARNLSSQLGG